MRRPLFAASLFLVACDPTPPAEPNAPTPGEVTATATAAWTVKAPMSVKRGGPVAASIKNSSGVSIVYAAGGYGGSSPELRSLEAYNPVTNKWSTKAPMPLGKVQMDGATVVNGRLYVIGGWNHLLGGGGSVPAGGIFEYTPATNKWRTRANLCCSGDGAVGVIGGKIYVVSGTDGAGPVAHLDRYDPMTDTWTSLEEGPHTHFDPAYGVIGGKLYVVGGSECCSSHGELDVYDPSTAKWTTKAPMPVPVSGAAGVVMKGKLYVIGGDYSFETSVIEHLLVATVQVYDPGMDKWSFGVPFPTPRVGLAAAAVTTAGKTVAYVVGGGSAQTLLYDPTVPNKPPTAKANGPYTGTVGQPVQFSSLGSFDPEGAWNGTWTFGDGTSYTGIFGNGASQNPSHTYASPGSYPVTFTVTDDSRTSTTASTIASIQ